MARVALCDDHEVIMEGQRRILEAKGHEVCLTVGNGRDLVRAVRTGLALDLLVVDVSMPKLNGIDAIMQVLEVSPKIHCIVMSMHEDPARITEALCAGAKGYVSKESEMSQFEDAVEKVLSGGTYISPQLCYDVIVYGGKRVIGDRLPTSREREVIQLVAEGNSHKEIAHELAISVRGVRFHREVLSRELHLVTVADITKYAVRHGLAQL